MRTLISILTLKTKYKQPIPFPKQSHFAVYFASIYAIVEMRLYSIVSHSTRFDWSFDSIVCLYTFFMCMYFWVFYMFFCVCVFSFCCQSFNRNWKWECSNAKDRPISLFAPNFQIKTYTHRKDENSDSTGGKKDMKKSDKSNENNATNGDYGWVTINTGLQIGFQYRQWLR